MSRAERQAHLTNEVDGLDSRVGDLEAAQPTFRNKLINAAFSVFHAGAITACSATPTIDTSSSPLTLNRIWTVASGLTAGNVAVLMANNNTAHIHLSAEL